MAQIDVETGYLTAPVDSLDYVSDWHDLPEPDRAPRTYSVYLCSPLERLWPDKAEWQVSRHKRSRTQFLAEGHFGKKFALILDTDLREEWLAFNAAINSSWYWRHFTDYHYYSRFKYFVRRFSEFSCMSYFWSRCGMLRMYRPKRWPQIVKKVGALEPKYGGDQVWDLAYGGFRYYCEECWKRQRTLAYCERCH